jgi:hypothetical protein
VTYFQRGADFPHEGFVQRAIESHFSRLGFVLECETLADLVCVHEHTAERWLIEAKGATSSIGLDFRTGLGQLIQRMTDPSTKYALAIPYDERFLAQCGLVTARVREAIGLYWLIVKPDGSVATIPPDQTVRVVGVSARLAFPHT